MPIPPEVLPKRSSSLASLRKLREVLDFYAISRTVVDAWHGVGAYRYVTGKMLYAVQERMSRSQLKV